MLTSSVLAVLSVLVGLMVLDWYVWDPRWRHSASVAAEPRHNGKHEITRHAA